MSRSVPRLFVPCVRPPAAYSRTSIAQNAGTIAFQPVEHPHRRVRLFVREAPRQSHRSVDDNAVTGRASWRSPRIVIPPSERRWAFPKPLSVSMASTTSREGADDAGLSAAGAAPLGSRAALSIRLVAYASTPPPCCGPDGRVPPEARARVQS